jgi:uracil-DNA glycosylase family 4
LTGAERKAALDAVAAEVTACTRCRLHQGRTHAVPGEGNPETEVVFVGEGPGFHEDRLARPFVGQAGALLEELLKSIDWRRDEVFITNVVKCRPPDNRDPEPDEIAACAPFLTRQLEALDPALVVTLGRYSMARFNPGARIGQVHGTFRPAAPGSGAPRAMTYAMYHPAAALHQGSLKAALFADMKGVPDALTAARAARDDASAGAQTAESAAPAPSEPVAVDPAPAEAQPVLPAEDRPNVTADVTDDVTDEAGPQADPTSQLSLF